MPSCPQAVKPPRPKAPEGTDLQLAGDGEVRLLAEEVLIVVHLALGIVLDARNPASTAQGRAEGRAGGRSEIRQASRWRPRLLGRREGAPSELHPPPPHPSSALPTSSLAFCSTVTSSFTLATKALFSLSAAAA